MAPTTTQALLARLPPYVKYGSGALLAALTIAFYWFVFYSDAAAKIEGAKLQKKSLRDELAEQQQQAAGYFADRDELALREVRSRALNKVLPGEAQEDAFLSSIQQASNAAGIDLKGYAPLEEVAQNFYAKVPMRLEMTGHFHQIAKFAYELSKVDRIINVEDIELMEPKIVGDEVVLKGKCLATAFHAMKPKDVRGVTAPASSGAPPAPAASGGAR